MFPIFHRVRVSVLIMTALIVGALGMITGCGARNDDAAEGPPIPDSPREVQGPGTPIKFFGAGGARFRPGANDPEYQEYLLWKEWKEYKRYQEFVKSERENTADTADTADEQSDSQ